ncbi:MAG: prephenate/arogenate dehydrogenase family protein [Candidatus Pacebacteria bacterium]|nr:prephenate/arogenate dehydrogenase family protein [Candidatus Paceibacterota bacterium]
MSDSAIKNLAPGELGRVVIIGYGLIGSSLARVILRDNLASELVCVDGSAEVRAKAMELKIAHRATDDLATEAAIADLIIIATPIGAVRQIAEVLGKVVRPATVITDVCSVKVAVADALRQFLPHHRRTVPAHPIAGTEFSGPEAGFAEVFNNRWCILTPEAEVEDSALNQIKSLWQHCGSNLAEMSSEHHDRVLAITSHLPHLIAYTIVGTVTDLGTELQSEIIKYSASGFRDFTRIAASDPVMWRDVFLNNREPVLEMVMRLQEDLAIMQRAIRTGDGKTLQEHFSRTRAIRRSIIAANQA